MIHSDPVVVSSPVGRLRRQVAIGVWAVMVGCSGASRPPNLNDSHLFKDAGGSGTGGGSGMGGSPDASGNPDPNDPFGSCVPGASDLPSWPFGCSNGRSLCIGGGVGLECDAHFAPGCSTSCAPTTALPTPTVRSRRRERPDRSVNSHLTGACFLCQRHRLPDQPDLPGRQPWLPLDGVTGNSVCRTCACRPSLDAPDLDGGQ
jgi:hypothetical protein